MTKRNDVSVKMDTTVVEECRVAAAHCGKTLAEYISDVMREASARDIDAAIAKRLEAKAGPKAKAPPKGSK